MHVIKTIIHENQVLGTDGLFDVMDNDRVGRCVCEYLDRRNPALSVADVLTMEAQELWKTMGNDVRFGACFLLCTFTYVYIIR